MLRAHHIFIYPSRIVQKLLSKTPSDDDMISTLYSDTKTRDFTIFAHTNLILLDALLNTGKFQDYFSHANQLCAISSISFARSIMTRVVAYAAAMLSQYVDSVYQNATVKIKTKSGHRLKIQRDIMNSSRKRVV